MFRSFQGTLREMSLPLASYASFLSVDVCLTSYIHTYLPTLFILHGKIFSLYYDIKFHYYYTVLEDCLVGARPGATV